MRRRISQKADTGGKTSEQPVQVEEEMKMQERGPALDGNFLFLLALVAIASVSVNHRVIKLDKLFSLVYRGENTWALSVKVNLPFVGHANPIHELYKQTEDIFPKVNKILAPNSTVIIKTWLIPRNNISRLQQRYPVLASGKISHASASPMERFFTAYYTAKARKNKTPFMNTFFKTLNAPWSEITYITPLGPTPPLS